MKRTKFENQYGIECDVISPDEVHPQFFSEIKRHGAKIIENVTVEEEWTTGNTTENSTQD